MDTARALYEYPPLRGITGETLRPGGLAVTRRALALCGLSAPARIADVGCGAGASLAFFQEQGFQCIGFDRSFSLLREAKSRAPVALADAGALPLHRESVDAVACECALSLVADPRAALAEYARVLRRGGWLILSDMVRRPPQGQSAADSRTRNAADPQAQVAAAPRPALSSCVQGAGSVEEMHTMLEQAGFCLRAQVDCTRELKELAARMVLQHGSPAAFWHAWQRHTGETAPTAGRASSALGDTSVAVGETSPATGERPASSGAEVPLCWRGLGYALFVAQKTEQRARRTLFSAI